MCETVLLQRSGGVGQGSEAFRTRPQPQRRVWQAGAAAVCGGPAARVSASTLGGLGGQAGGSSNGGGLEQPAAQSGCVFGDAQGARCFDEGKTPKRCRWGGTVYVLHVRRLAHPLAS